MKFASLLIDMNFIGQERRKAKRLNLSGNKMPVLGPCNQKIDVCRQWELWEISTRLANCKKKQEKSLTI